jgi:ABC-type glycerol-3-phosphate transport system substrate-binding protein
MVGPDGERHNYQLANSGTSFLTAFNVALAREAGLDVDNPPRDWSEYLDWCAALTKDTDGDGKIDQWGTTLPTGDVGWHLNDGLFFLYQATGSPDLVSKDRKNAFIVDFADEAAMWLEFCKTIYQEEYCPQEQLAEDPWGMGKVGMRLLGLASHIPAWKRDYPELEFSFFSHPAPAGKAGITLGQAGGNVIWRMNTKTDAELSASWELLKFMNRPAVVRYQLQTRGGIPGVYGVDLGGDLGDLDPFVKELEKSNSLINYSPEYFKVRNIFVVEYNRAIRGKISVEEALANTVEKCQRIFE